MLIDIIASSETDFLRIASIIAAIQKEQEQGSTIRYRLIYTGKQTDRIISDGMRKQMSIPRPHINLEVSARNQTEQTATLMVRYAKVLQSGMPRLTLVTGDSEAATACAMTARKTGKIEIAHLDAGIRSAGIAPPEEVNRIVCDSLTNHFFTSYHSANQNLRRVGVDEERIFMVGNTIADTLIKHQLHFQRPPLWNALKLAPQSYLVVNLQRAENLGPRALRDLMQSIVKYSNGIPVLITGNRAADILKNSRMPGAHLINTPILPYLQSSYLLQHAKAIITDVGELQEIATILRVPCMTPGEHTERTETFTHGTNELVNYGNLTTIFSKLNSGEWDKGHILYMWDGKAAERIVTVFKNL